FNIGSYHGTPPPFDEPQYISSRSPSPVQLVSHMTERKAPPMSIAQLLSDRGSREPSPDYMNEHRHFNEDRNRMSRQDWSHAPYMSEKLKTGRESSPSGLGHFRDQSPGQDLPKHHIHANLPHSVQPATALAEKNKKHTTARAGRTEHSSIRREPTGSSSRGSGYSQYGRAHSPDYEGYYSKGAAGSSSRSNRYPDEFHPPPHMGLYEETQSISTESTRTDHWPEREQSEAPSLHPRDMHERHGQTPIQIKRRVPTEIGIRSSRVKTEEVKPKGRRGRKPKEREIPLEAPGTKLPIEPEGGVASSLSLYDDHPISSRAAHAGPGIGGDSWSRRPRRSDSLTDVQQVHEAIRNIGLDQNERAAGGFGDKARDMSSRRLEAPPTRRSDLSDIDPEDVALYSDMRKRGPRDHYEKQAMQKRRKLQESGLESQNRMTGSSVLGPDAMDDDGYLGSRASYEGSSMSGAPSHSHLAIPTRGRGRGRRKLQATSADSRLRYGLGEGRGSSGAMSQETKAEKKRRERKAAAQAAAMAQVEAIKARARAHENGHSVITSSSGGRAGPSSPGNAPSASGMDYDDDEPDAHVPRSIPFDADSDGAEFSQDGRADFDVSDDEEGDGEDMTNHLDDRGIKHELMFEETPAQRQEREYEARRRAIWDLIAHRHIREATKVVALTTSTKLSNCKKVAQLCQREARKAAARSVKSSKEIHARARRANREMLFFWKRNEKEERDMRKKAEKEAIERLRIEEEMREARRQARKLNFLITQTELYSHFIGKKIGTEAAETDDDDARVRMQPNDTSEASILQDPNHTPIQGELDFEEASDETLEAQAKWGAQQALLAAQQRTKTFDEADKEHREDRRTMSINQDDFDEMNFQNPSSMPTGAEIEQPKMLMCQLKGYQIKGLNWLANLYEQGINGILADEMGLGKTVQSISLMAYLAEVQNIWGPFLVIAPASTLHNWQQEFAKFTPGLKALPYWGNPTDRKTLRKIWTKKQIYTKDSPFHVVVTSYQLVVSDEKYFQRVKWQYMVLDEAQAIKSSSSARWKTLLGFNCRNRLLLTGTPIQNSMQELWALLHFIMPSLFDSHEEFSEWFSKDIESHAENKGTLNEHQLKRLHMILKPFMLRRIKKNVQNELGDKIELEVRCELTARQRALYRGLKDKISISELLEKASSLNDTDSVDSLMNLVMQFRKVCNHPELFERADVASPLALCAFSQTPSIAREGDDLYVAYTTRSNISYSIPKRFYRDGGLLNIPCESSNAGSDTKYLDNLLNIWNPGNIVESMYEQDGHGAFSFLRFVDYSPSEANKLFHASVMDRFCHHLETAEVRSRRGYGLRGDGIHSLEEEDPEAAGNTFARLEISEANNLFSPHNTLLSHMQPLGRVLPQSNIGQSLTIMEPAFRPKAVAPPIEMICSDRGFLVEQRETLFDIRIRQSLLGLSPLITEIPSQPEEPSPVTDLWQVTEGRGILGEPTLVSMGYSTIAVPQMKQLVMDSGKLAVLDKLLVELKAGGHRVLLYFQMTRMIDLMEEYLTYRQYKYLRLDGSSKISDRRDMVTDWQTRPEIFIFLLSTRAGGLGINLTAADTVIFYDSDWNPTVDQQAMDRAHRLGQTRQVTVYRLITRGTIEERILTRAKQKDEIQKVVISGGEFKQSVEFKPREIVSLLLDDDELATKLQEQQMKRKVEEEEAKQSRKSIKEARGEARPTKRARRGDKGEAGSSSNGNGKGLSSSGNVSTPPGSLVGTPGIESEGTNGSPGNGSGEDKVRGATTTGVRRRRGRGSKEMGEPREPRRGRGGGRGGRKASRLGQVTTLGDEGGEGGRTVNMDDLDVDLEGL
ncbi:putative DNA helicase ino80, partial [Lunasporangiospora selenospora]